MSERERWVVYPLLFLALGVAFRDKMLKRVETHNVGADRVYSKLTISRDLFADRIVCHHLEVQGPSGRPVATIDRNAKTGSGQLKTYNAQGRPTDVVGIPASMLVRLPPWLWPGNRGTIVKPTPKKRTGGGNPPASGGNPPASGGAN